jgi:hypothetical protein
MEPERAPLADAVNVNDCGSPYVLTTPENPVELVNIRGSPSPLSSGSVVVSTADILTVSPFWKLAIETVVQHGTVTVEVWPDTDLGKAKIVVTKISKTRTTTFVDAKLLKDLFTVPPI